MNDTAAPPVCKVLVVDDTAANLVAMRRLLGRMSCQLVEAASGNAALAACLEHDFALILLDVQMPEMDGFEVAALLADNPRTRDVPIIFVTAAFKDDLNRIHGYRVGAVDYIAKPIDEFILRSKVQVFLDLYASRQQLQQAMTDLAERNSALQREIAERQRAEDEARHQATHDPLTQLPNRLLFMDRLNTGLARARRESRPLALLYVDVDRFKPVNDQHGHGAGDELLKGIAERLRGLLRRTDTVARLGGDEFAMVLESVSGPEEVQQIAGLIETSLSRPFRIHSGEKIVEVQVGGSVGAALFPHDADSSDSLLRAADAQMYRRKHGRSER